MLRPDAGGLWAVEADWARGLGTREVVPIAGDRNPEREAAEILAMSSEDIVRSRMRLDQEGIAYLPVSGPLVKSALMAWWYDGTSTQILRQKLRAAAEIDAVRGVMLVVDSPGGTVAGTADLADEIARTAAAKPVHAYVEDLCASAALWSASQAGTITAGRTALVGSIGTIAVVYDTSKMFAERGIEVHVFSTGDFKGAGEPGTEITDAQRAEFQERVNALNEHFLEGLSRGRGMDRKALEQIADGRVFSAEGARAHGLIDGVGSFEDAVLALRAEVDQAEANERRRFRLSATLRKARLDAALSET